MPAGLLDTSVVFDWDDPTVAGALPEEVAVCAITLAELAAGPHVATSSSERSRRQARLQQVEATPAEDAHATVLVDFLYTPAVPPKNTPP